MALLAAMRQTMGAPYRKLSVFSTECLQVPLSPSGALGIIARVADRMAPISAGIAAALRELRPLRCTV